MLMPVSIIINREFFFALKLFRGINFRVHRQGPLTRHVNVNHAHVIKISRV